MIQKILTIAILATAAFAMTACESMNSGTANDRMPAGGDRAKAPQSESTGMSR